MSDHRKLGTTAHRDSLVDDPNCCTGCRLGNEACLYHASFGLHPLAPLGSPLGCKQPITPSPAGCSEGYAWQADRFTTK